MATGELTEKPDELLMGGGGGHVMDWIGILAWVQIYISMHSRRNKWHAKGLNRGNEVFFPLQTEKFQHRFVNVRSFYLIFHDYFNRVDLITEDAFRQ